MSHARLSTRLAQTVQAASANVHQAAHVAALLLTEGAVALEATAATTGATLAIKGIIGAAAGVAAQAIPYTAFAMGFAGVVLGTCDFVASYLFEGEIDDRFYPSIYQRQQRLSKNQKTFYTVIGDKLASEFAADSARTDRPEILSREELNAMKRENLRWHGAYVALSSLPVAGLAYMALSPSFIPAVLSGFSVCALSFLGMAITSGFQLLAELNTLANARSDELDGMKIISPVFKAMETAGFAMLAFGNPMLGLAFLGASFYGQYKKGTLTKDTFANLSSSASVLFSPCRAKEDKDGQDSLMSLPDVEAKPPVYSYRPAL